MDYQELENMWNGAVVEPREDFGNLPDGKYQVRVETCRLTETKEAKNPMLAWELTVVSPLHYEKRKVFHNRVIRDQESAKWAKQDFVNLGIQADTMTDLMDNLEKVLDCIIEIQLKTKGEFQNVYINKNLGKPLGTVVETPFTWG